jgi:hypothetical protein
MSDESLTLNINVIEYEQTGAEPYLFITTVRGQEGSTCVCGGGSALSCASA